MKITTLCLPVLSLLACTSTQGPAIEGTPGAPSEPLSTEEFSNKVTQDAASMAAIWMAGIGDRLGLFKDLAENGPATAAQLAQRTNTQGRYVVEWASQMSAAGYLLYDATTERFTIPRRS